jgi:hypothetical protein
MFICLVYALSVDLSQNRANSSGAGAVGKHVNIIDEAYPSGPFAFGIGAYFDQICIEK